MKGTGWRKVIIHPLSVVTSVIKHDGHTENGYPSDNAGKYHEREADFIRPQYRHAQWDNKLE